MRFVGGARLPSVTDYGIYGFFGDYRFLSNYHVLDDLIYMSDGFWYYSSEAAYMAGKTLDKRLKETLSTISRDPAECKKFAKSFELRKDWDKVKETVMLEALRAKFKQPDLKEKLLATGVRTLEETNNWGDTYWGAIVDPEGFPGYGYNRLGVLLMIVREELRG